MSQPETHTWEVPLCGHGPHTGPGRQAGLGTKSRGQGQSTRRPQVAEVRDTGGHQKGSRHSLGVCLGSALRRGGWGGGEARTLRRARALLLPAGTAATPREAPRKAILKILLLCDSSPSELHGA